VTLIEITIALNTLNIYF